MFATPRTVDDPSACWFYHVIDDVPGTENAPWDLRGQFKEYIGNVNCAGKRVLDVGCASGFLSFSAEQEGAAEVVSFDMDSAARQHLLPFRDTLYYTDHPAWVIAQNRFVDSLKEGYWFAHRAIGSKAKVCYGDVYALPDALGSFDVVLVGAVLEHLSDPIRALASIARHAKTTLVVNTGLLDTEDRIAHFMGDAAKPDISYVFWLYSLGDAWFRHHTHGNRAVSVHDSRRPFPAHGNRCGTSIRSLMSASWCLGTYCSPAQSRTLDVLSSRYASRAHSEYTATGHSAGSTVMKHVASGESAGNAVQRYPT